MKKRPAYLRTVAYLGLLFAGSILPGNCVMASRDSVVFGTRAFIATLLSPNTILNLLGFDSSGNAT